MKEAFIEKDGKIVRFLYATATKDGLVTFDLTDTQTVPEKYTLEAKAEIPEVKIPVTGTDESEKYNATVSPVSVTISGTLTKDAGGSSSSQNINCIGKKSFADDTTLQRIVLPRTLETIEENAFENCKELQIVEMPCSDDVKGAGQENTKGQTDSSGSDDQHADKNTGNGENSNQSDAESQEGKNNGNQANNQQPAPAEKLTVQYSAFKNCRKLHTVDLSGAQSLHIEAEAFADCDSLRTVVLPENCSISENAFTGCRPDILCFVAPKDSGAGEYAREHNYRFVEK